MGALHRRAPTSLLLVAVLLLGAGPPVAVRLAPAPEPAGVGARGPGRDAGLVGAAPDRWRALADRRDPSPTRQPFPPYLGTATAWALLAAAAARLAARPRRRGAARARFPAAGGPRSPPSPRLA